MRPEQLFPGLYLPEYSGNSIVSLANYVLSHFNVTPAHTPLSLLKDKGLHEKKKMVLIILDAVGSANLKTVSDHSPTLSHLLTNYEQYTLTSVFPTTTTTALTSFCTGLYPLEHGMLGYNLLLKEFNAVVNMLKMAPPELERDLLTNHGLNPVKFLNRKTLFERLAENGIKPWTITSNLFKDSGLSKLHHYGSAIRGYSDMTELFFQLKRTLLQEKHETFIFTYWGLTDTFGHQYGVDSEIYRKEIELFFRLFDKEIVKELPKNELNDTLFLISADHGQIQTSWKDEEWLTLKDPIFNRFLSVPFAGEPRALYLYCRHTEGFEEEFNMRFGKRFLLIPREEAVKRDFFSYTGDEEMTEEERTGHLDRLGDYVAVAKRKNSLHYKIHGNTTTLKGKHGSLTKDEMFVPLLVLA